MRLEKKHFAAYLPYGLICEVINWDAKISRYRTTISELHAVYSDGSCVFHDLVESEQGFQSVRPILRPLTDLTIEIEVNGEKFVPIDWLEDKYYTLDLHKQCLRLLEEDGENWVNQSDYMLIEYLKEWHFDIFGLITEGLATDANKLK